VCNPDDLDRCLVTYSSSFDFCQAFQVGASGLKKDLDILLKNLGPHANTQTAGVSGVKWQNASASGLDAARRLDRILRALLTTSDAPMSPDEALPKLQQSMSDLELAVSELAASIM
jgi:hypothetical protein